MITLRLVVSRQSVVVKSRRQSSAVVRRQVAVSRQSRLQPSRSPIVCKPRLERACHAPQLIAAKCVEELTSIKSDGCVRVSAIIQRDSFSATRVAINSIHLQSAFLISEGSNNPPIAISRKYAIDQKAPAETGRNSWLQ